MGHSVRTRQLGNTTGVRVIVGVGVGEGVVVGVGVPVIVCPTSSVRIGGGSTNGGTVLSVQAVLNTASKMKAINRRRMDVASGGVLPFV
jgi:hypothetical protein